MDSIFNITENDTYGSFTKRDFARILFKHKKVILTSFITVTVILTLSLIWLPPAYRFNAKILIKTEQQVNPAFFEGVTSTRMRVGNDPVNRSIETEMELIETRPISEQVVKNLDLKYDEVYRKPYVHILSRLSDGYDTILSLFGVKKDPDKYGFEATVTALVKSISVAPVKSKSSDVNSNIVQVSMLSANRETGLMALNTLLETYTRHETDLNRAAGENAYKIVESKMKESFEDLKQAQKKLRLFMTHNSTTTGNDESVPEAQIDENDKITFPAEKDLKQAALTDQYGNDPGNETDAMFISLKNEATVALLKSRLIQLELELDKMQQTYNDNDDKIKKIKNRIRDLQTLLKTEITNYARNKSIQSDLERELEAAENIYMELQNRLAKISLFLDVNESKSGNRIIIEPPVEPRSSEWKKRVFTGIIGSLAGLFLGLGIAGFREYMDHTLYTKQDVKRYLDLDVLTVIPEQSTNLDTFFTTGFAAFKGGDKNERA